MKCTRIFMASLLAANATSGMAAQQPGAADPPNGREPLPNETAQPATGRPPPIEFRDADGNPLPPEVQEQLREHFRNNPLPIARAKPVPGEPGEIVVSGEPPRGAVVGTIPPERSFSQLDIRAYGASTIEELLDALGPQVASNRGRGDNPPVTLLNGRRISDFSEIARIPTEAIERMEVFPEELALQYGYRADQKVVNVVTYERFDSQFGQLTLPTATEGGWTNGTIEADHFQIIGDTRLSLTASYGRSGALLESERDIAQPAEAPDQGRFRTLLPASERMELGGLVGRPLGQSVSATLDARFAIDRSEGLLGLQDDRALRRDTDRQSFRIGTTLNGRAERWLWTFGGNYNRAETDIDTDPAISATTRDRADFLDTLLEADLLLAGPVAELPAGFLRASIGGSFESRDFESISLRGGAEQRTDLSRRSGGVQFSLDAPVLGSAASGETPLGTLSANANLALESLSDAGTLRTYGFGLTWSPVDAVNLVASATREEGAPTLQQLGGPVLETPTIRTFDFARGEVVDVTRVSGGNPGLLEDDRDILRLGLNIKPLARTDLTVSLDYVSTRTDRPIASFPVVLPEVEAAFPDRVQRDRDGRLVRIDGRPVNFATAAQKQLRWGVNFSRPLGPVPPEARTGTGRTFASAEEARRAFPNATVIIADAGSPMARRAENTRSRVFVSLYHNWYLQDEVTLLDGLAPLDLLDGGAVDFAGGRRRHEFELQGGVFQRGLGARLTATWRSGTDVRGAGGAAGDLRFDSLTTVNLNLFANLPERFGGADAPGWLKGTRATIGVNNLFNDRQQVRDGGGLVPLAYQPGYLDPLGRTVSFSLRKVF